MTKEQLEAFEKITPGMWAIPVANVFRVIAPEAKHRNKIEGSCPPYPWAIVADMDTDSQGGPQAAANAAAISALPELLQERKRMIEVLKAAQSIIGLAETGAQEQPNSIDHEQKVDCASKLIESVLAEVQSTEP